MKNLFKYIFLGAIVFSSCSKDFLDIDPESTINDDQLATSPEATNSILRGIYSGLKDYGLTGWSGHEDYGHKSLLTSLDLMGHDMVMFGLNWHGFNYDYTGRIMSNSRAHLPWYTYYTQIKNANIIINNIPGDTEDASMKAIRGQALSLRGFFHFMLARIYGPTYVGNQGELCIPINAEEMSAKRNSVQEVYSKIVADLEEAVDLLDGYVRPNKEFIDQSVANAFLADVLLEMGRYEEAAVAANNARQGYNLLSKEDWQNGFYRIEQDETMWGGDLNEELSTWVANFFSHMDNTNSGYSEGGNIAIDRRLYEAMSATDIRKEMFAGPEGGTITVPNSNGILIEQSHDPYISFKFRDLTSNRTSGDYIYLRSALMYYIESEALARSGNEAQAKQVLFEITKERDPNYTLSTNSGQALIDEIIMQKRIEMWGEGFAWFDLKRLNRGVDRNYSGSNHVFAKLVIPAGDNKFLFMIPQAEIDANPEILPNNPE